jgi:hypothetical protein
MCGTGAGCSAINYQSLFNFLELGRHRLWKTSGQGNSDLLLRKVDIKYMKENDNLLPKFLFGITILKNVSVIERGIDGNGNDVVRSISGGKGTVCNVNYPTRMGAHINDSQRDALAKAQATLPPNFMDRAARKRKADALDGTKTSRLIYTRRLMRLVSLEQKLQAY